MSDRPELEAAGTFYIDESGNSGDLSRGGEGMTFGGQEIFTLASFGVRDADAIAAEIARLFQVFGIQARELKSSAVKGKPALVRDLISFLRRHDLPLLIEVVDKRFMIAANMINTLVLPPVGACDSTPQSQWFRNILAEHLHAEAPSSVFAAYLAACDSPAAASVTAAFQAMLAWLDTRGEGDEVAEALRFFTRDSFDDFKEAGPESEEAQRRCLPIPDQNKRGQSIWMLPNLTSLTNLYARINRYRRRQLGGVVIVHDQQAHFDAILIDAKSMVEQLAFDGNAISTRFADYDFTEQAQLRFVDSGSTPGIQAADVIAGFVMRYVKAVLHDRESPDCATREAFDAIVELTDPARGLGINFVLSNCDIVRLGLLPV